MPDATLNGCVTDRPVRASLALEARAEQVPAARSFMANALGPLHPCADVAVLLTSELVTNSVRYSGCRHLGQTINVTAVLTASGVRVEVTDCTGPTVPAVRTEGGMAEGGRGLQLVQALAANWGYKRLGGRTTTWFVCARLPPASTCPPSR